MLHSQIPVDKKFSSTSRISAPITPIWIKKISIVFFFYKLHFIYGTFSYRVPIFRVIPEKLLKNVLFLMKNEHFQSRITQKVFSYRKMLMGNFLLKIHPSIHFCNYFYHYFFHPLEGVASTPSGKAHYGAI